MGAAIGTDMHRDFPIKTGCGNDLGLSSDTLKTVYKLCTIWYDSTKLTLQPGEYGSDSV